MTTRLVADAVFTVDGDDRVLQPGAVEIDAGLITWVGDPTATPAGPGTTTRDLGGILMPGLVNCHGHSPMTLLRSAGDGLPLDRWLSEAVWPREARLTDEDVYWGMVLGADELLCNGVTTTCEQYRHPGIVAEAAVDSGIRCLLTPGIFDVPGHGPEGEWEFQLAEACRMCSTRWTAGRAGSISVSVRTPPTACRPEGWPAVAEAAGRRGALVQIHLAETKAEGAVVMERYGMGAPALLASLGVFDGRVLAAHSVWLDETEIALMAEHDVAVAHCPGSNGKLGAGVAKLTRMLAHGLRVGLGTDGPASNDDLHLWDEMRLAALLARATATDPGALGSDPRSAPPGHPGRRRGVGPAGRVTRGGPRRRHHQAEHRRRPLHPSGQPGGAAGSPGLGRRRAPGDRRLGRGARPWWPAGASDADRPRTGPGPRSRSGPRRLVDAA